ncbi:UDP-glycosyltransferase 86A1 [Sesamum angolense]|uniref:Glycosyltransferase n=1 Tax=Sesamum angolense TaxID=2727404 RepID=A0AAE1WNE0_9LAMI|nr:UDP-glycosyltransferase 86A1 [Sesamum angolense]
MVSAPSHKALIQKFVSISTRKNLSTQRMAERKLHAIMIAFSFQGHITPFINLALKLASNGCTVTFVHTEFIHHMLSKAHHNITHVDDVDFFSAARESGLDIRYTTISDGFPPDYDRILNFNEYWEAILRNFPSCVHEFVGRIIQSTDESLVPFLTHLDLLRENGFFPSKGNQEDVIDFVPGVQSIKPKDLMSYLQDVDIKTVTHQIVFKAFDQVKHADFILINTVHELEHETLLALNQKQLTYAIGPINFSTDFTKTIVPKSLWSETDCTEWLNSKPAGSVLYISFGSIAQSSKQLAEEIANGLLLSEVNFVWVLRENTDVLPDGFKNQVRGRGLIVSWCNQNSVLSSPATAGFLTHCGWNSILESISCGVPMICFPFYADQPTNRKLVVDDWKVGINLCDGSSVDRKEVAEKIKQLMSGEISNGLRGEMKKIRTIVQKALAEGGSTRRNFNQFLKDLRAKVHGRSQDISTS